MKKQKGITLIALIITIIVLLILAGVSISLVVGQNGILEKSQEAVTETKKASIEEQIQLAWAACETEFIVNSKAQNRSKYFDISDLNQNLSQGDRSFRRRLQARRAKHAYRRRLRTFVWGGSNDNSGFA